MCGVRRWLLGMAVAACAVSTLPAALAHAQTAPTSGDVYYHDQSGTVLSAITAAQAISHASQRLHFAVRAATTWPSGSRLRAVWVMDRHTPRFVVLYYGGDDGYVTCQVRESLDASAVVLKDAAATTIAVDGARGTLRQADIGGVNPVSEIVWRAHGIRYDLLGSVQVPLHGLVRMANSL